MNVDTHVHVWELSSDRFPWKPFGKVAPSFSYPVEQQVKVMEQAGIDKGVIVQTSFYGYDNRYILDCLRRYPGRFAAIAIVDPGSPSVERDIEDLAAHGAKGFRLAPMLRPDMDWYNDRLWRKIGELGLILTLLVTPSQLRDAGPTIERFPTATVVIDHLARPDMEADPARPCFKQLLALARFPNVYVKASALPVISREPYPYADVLELTRRATEAFGAERVMWGTDYGLSQDVCSMDRALDLVDQALDGTGPKASAQVKGDTAAGLFGLI